MRYAQSVNGIVDLVGGEEVGLTCERTEPNVRVRESEVAQIGWLWDEEKECFFNPNPLPTPQELASLKQQELLSACYADIYGKFTIWDKQFACDSTARDDINDLVYAKDKVDFTGRYWFTFGGTELVYITKEMVVPFKDAVVQHKDDCWEHYAELMNQLSLIDLSLIDASEKIALINW